MVALLPDANKVRIAAIARLRADATLMALLAAVVSGNTPENLDGAPFAWAEPILDVGIQAGGRDRANGYRQRGKTIIVRLQAHSKGPAPGVGSTDALYAILARADITLKASALSVTGHTVWRLEYTGDIPERTIRDTAGYLRMSAGALYEVRLY